MYYHVKEDRGYISDIISFVIYEDSTGKLTMYSVYQGVAVKTNDSSIDIENYLRFRPYLQILYEGEEPPEDIKFE